MDKLIDHLKQEAVKEGYDYIEKQLNLKNNDSNFAKLFKIQTKKNRFIDELLKYSRERGVDTKNMGTAPDSSLPRLKLFCRIFFEPKRIYQLGKKIHNAEIHDNVKRFNNLLDAEIFFFDNKSKKNKTISLDAKAFIKAFMKEKQSTLLVPMKKESKLLTIDKSSHAISITPVSPIINNTFYRIAWATNNLGLKEWRYVEKLEEELYQFFLNKKNLEKFFSLIPEQMIRFEDIINQNNFYKITHGMSKDQENIPISLNETVKEINKIQFSAMKNPVSQKLKEIWIQKQKKEFLGVVKEFEKSITSKFQELPSKIF